MRRKFPIALPLLAAAALPFSVLCSPTLGQVTGEPDPAKTQTPSGQAVGSDGSPLPDPGALMRDVQANEERMDALRNDYTYHVHLQQERMRKDGSVKENEVTDSESLTLDGVRVDRVVARNGKPLTPDEQAKENDRLDKAVAKAKERRAKAAANGQMTDPRGDTVITVARLLELGSFSHERRVEYGGRPTIVLDYAGDPKAKTRSSAEAVVKDIVGTVWIDEADRVVVRGQGHFLNDFKIGGGLVADVRRDSNFDFEAKRVNDAVWLPATINGQGSVRILLVAGFDGQLHLTASDYRRFRTSTRIIPAPTAQATPAANHPDTAAPVATGTPPPTGGP